MSILALTTCIAIADSVILDKKEDLRFYEYYSVLTAKSDKMTDAEDYIKKLKNDGLINDYFLGRVQYIGTKTIAENTRRPVIQTKKEDVQKILNHIGAKYEEPDLNSTKKIILSEKIVKNKKLQYGDEINTKRVNYEQFMGNSFNFSATIELSTSSQKYMNIGMAVIPEEESPSHIILLNNSKKFKELMVELSRITDNGDKNIMYHEYMSDQYEKSTKSMLRLLHFLTAIVSIVESVCVCMLFYMYINSRNEEIGLLMLIGYSKCFVMIKLIVENFLLILFGWLFSWVLSHNTFEFINRSLFAPLYVSQLTIFNQEVFKFSLIIPMVVMITTVFTIILKIFKSDPVSIIETK
ncbi:MAG: FtsX-like permease family protein [Patescibacteria group bacterium]